MTPSNPHPSVDEALIHNRRIRRASFLTAGLDAVTHAPGTPSTGAGKNKARLAGSKPEMTTAGEPYALDPGYPRSCSRSGKDRQ